MKSWFPRRDTSLIVLVGLILLNIPWLAGEKAQAVTCTIGSTSMGQSVGILGTSQNSGTQANPFPLDSVADLVELDACIDAALTTGVSYQLTQDIDLAGSVISAPLGADNKSFRGSLSGASGSQILKISNISFSATAPTAGFFHELSSATVSDLVLEGKITYRPTTTGQFGGVAGEVQSSLIKNIVTYLDLDAQATSTTVNVGGIAGQYGASTFSSVSVAVSANHGSIRSVAGSSWVGGIVGRTWTTGQSSFRDIRVSVPIEVRALAFSAQVGGVIGSADLSGLAAFSSRSTIERAYVTSTLDVTLVKNSGEIGGIVGGVAEQSVDIRESVFSGFIVIPTDANAANTSVGGLIGGSSDPQGAHMSVSNASVEGALRTRGEAAFLGGVSGRLQDADASIEVDEVLLNGTIGNFSPSGTYDLANMATGAPRSVSGLIRNSDSWTSNLNPFSTARSSAELSDPSSVPLRDYSPAPADPAFKWNQCAVPFLSWLGSVGCRPSIVGAYIDSTGNNLVVNFSQRMDSAITSTSGLGLTIGSAQSVALTNPSWSANARELHMSLSSNVQKDWTLSLTAQVTALAAFSTSQSLIPEDNQYVVNLSTATGPTAVVSSTQASPSSISLQLSCGGSCGNGSSYSYVVSATPAGGSSVTISGVAATALTNLNFPGLSANTSHTIRAAVVFNGQSSATASSTISTPRPVATISSLVIADTSATLVVGCTNCGSMPDSFVITARPSGGGSAVASSTNSITGLSSETSYSFSVIIAFAGTTSNEVLWRGNPVMTLPFVPVIVSATPSQLPASSGGLVTVTGSNFSTSTTLTLNGSSLSFTVVDGGTILFTVPSGPSGSYDLAITNPVGTFTLSNAVSLIPQPTLATSSPGLATSNGGTIVTLTGANLETALDVYLGQATVSFSPVSSTKLRFITPTTVSGIVDVGVVTVGGSATISNGLEITSSPLVPVIGSVTPSAGPSAGGTLITITGKYFSGSYSHPITAAIGGITGSSILIIDDSTITMIVPPGQGSSLAISVSTGGGTGFLAGAFNYESAPLPTSTASSSNAVTESPTTSSEPTKPTPVALVERLSTRSISVEGGQITIFGFQLGRIESATFANLDLKILSNSSRQITLLIGVTERGTWNLVLRGPLGTTTIFRAISVL